MVIFLNFKSHIEANQPLLIYASIFKLKYHTIYGFHLDFLYYPFTSIFHFFLPLRNNIFVANC